ncbi:MAG: multidrug efflux RND transporter permease subunit [Myxococcota bacterium]|nr:multidrug efflux RND transporter permease subunit [Myxococcota bacterium]
MSRFFIERPIFATVLALAIMIAGGITLQVLPVSQYPEIAPPTVEVKTTYPGANAQVLAETVAAPIEQEINGVERMLYMSSTNTNDGTYTLNVTFEVGTDVDMAQVLVQNRVAIALPKLPEETRRQGVTTKKKSTAIVQLVSLISPDGTHDDLFLANYAIINVKDQLARLYGAGDVEVLPQSDYSMRVWLDPEKLESRRIATTDVVNAIREQNVQVAAGQIGQPPTPTGQNFQFVINTLGRLTDVEQFENIIVKAGEEGRVTRIKDVAKVELGAKTYDVFSELSGRPSVSLLIFQLPGANALQLADDVEAVMERLSERFPAGVEYAIPFDTTRFVRQAIDEVYTTLFVAALLVFATIFIFLQDWRASLVPAATIPVSLIGTFLVMGMLDFSVNLTTLFGLVLAIGIVVDDAIVVVENTARLVEDGMPARQAAIQAMEEVTGPVIATTLVLLAVFIPTAFLPGITGQLYRQFGLTIAAATVFSSINALTLSPALCAILIRPKPERQNALFRGFNRGFDALAAGYGRVVGALIRKAAFTMVAFGGIAFLAVTGFGSIPTGFLPEEDQGYLVAGAFLPEASSQERTREAVDKLSRIFEETPGIDNWVTLGGYSVLESTNLPNAITAWLTLDSFEERAEPHLSAQGILAHLYGEFDEVQEAMAFAFPPPAILGLGNAGGFQMEVQDTGGLGYAVLAQIVEEMVRDGNAQSELTGLSTTFRASEPQLFVDVNRTQAKRMHAPLANVFDTLQTYLGSTYVNDFNKFGRVYQVRVQAEPRFRVTPADIRRLYVRNEDGGMVPMGALVDIEQTLGPQIVRRFQLYPSAPIFGQGMPGVSSGQALSLMEQMAERKLPSQMNYAWTGISFQERQVGNEAIFIFALAITFVFLVLAAQYESWTAPSSILLSVPFAILGVVVALMARGMANDVYTQIGVVLLIGLASKTSILIVEFARQQRAAGKGLEDAAFEAARLRFRPVLMTTISFVFGTLPLLVATGAGAASRQAVGTAVFGGMVAATFLTVSFVPVFFKVFQGAGERLLGERATGPEDAESAPPAAGADPARSV